MKIKDEDDENEKIKYKTCIYCSKIMSDNCSKKRHEIICKFL